jgi:hypothetical protein
MGMDMVGIRPPQVKLEREEDGRFLASVPELPGVMACGDTEQLAKRKATAIAPQGRLKSRLVLAVS